MLYGSQSARTAAGRGAGFCAAAGCVSRSQPEGGEASHRAARQPPAVAGSRPRTWPTHPFGFFRVTTMTSPAAKDRSDARWPWRRRPPSPPASASPAGPAADGARAGAGRVRDGPRRGRRRRGPGREVVRRGRGDDGRSDRRPVSPARRLAAHGPRRPRRASRARRARFHIARKRRRDAAVECATTPDSARAARRRVAHGLRERRTPPRTTRSGAAGRAAPLEALVAARREGVAVQPPGAAPLSIFRRPWTRPRRRRAARRLPRRKVAGACVLLSLISWACNSLSACCASPWASSLSR